MGLVDSIQERLPGYTPTSTTRVSEDHTFEIRDSGVPKTVYRVEKSPFESLRRVTGIIAGTEREFVVGDEVEARDTNGDGEPDSVAFVDDTTLPDDGSTFTVTYTTDPNIVKYTGAYDYDLDDVGGRLDGVFDTKSINLAVGDELDRLGATFGEIGSRRGRGDEEYRSFLRSVVHAFNANGTAWDIQFAVAAALRGDPENVVVTEDTELVGFEVDIKELGESAMTSSLNELIELASPSGVKLLSPPILGSEGAIIAVVGRDSVIVDDSDGLGSSTLGAETLA